MSDSRLLLLIGTTPYDVAPARSPTDGPAAQVVRLVKLDGSKAPAEYLIVRDALDVISCNCPAALHRPAPGPLRCKHARAVVDCRLLSPPGPATPPARTVPLAGPAARPRRAKEAS